MKSNRVDEQMKKQDPSMCYLQKTHSRIKDIHRLKVKGMEKEFS
jgi:hypothetical protein